MAAIVSVTFISAAEASDADMEAAELTVTPSVAGEASVSAVLPLVSDFTPKPVAFFRKAVIAEPASPAIIT